MCRDCIRYKVVASFKKDAVIMKEKEKKEDSGVESDYKKRK